MDVGEHPHLEFGAVQIAAFAPLAPELESFAARYALELFRVQDRDPVNSYTACLLSWRAESPKTGGKCWISVCARDPAALSDKFLISANGQNWGTWEYSVHEGAEQLLIVLEQAWALANSPQDANAPLA